MLKYGLYKLCWYGQYIRTPHLNLDLFIKDLNSSLPDEHGIQTILYDPQSKKISNKEQRRKLIELTLFRTTNTKPHENY